MSIDCGLSGTDKAMRFDGLYKAPGILPEIVLLILQS